MRFLCRISWHVWAIGNGGQFRWCRHCPAGQRWTDYGSGGAWEDWPV
jgi:hypothetical protein